MQVDEKTVRHIARLARLKVSDEEVQNLEGELSSILDFVEQLNEVDTGDVDARVAVIKMDMKKRDDVVDDGEIADKIVQNAPLAEDHFFVVPKVVE